MINTCDFQHDRGRFEGDKGQLLRAINDFFPACTQQVNNLHQPVEIRDGHRGVVGAGTWSIRVKPITVIVDLPQWGVGKELAPIEALLSARASHLTSSCRLGSSGDFLFTCNGPSVARRIIYDNYTRIRNWLGNK
jgi:hypothetical protein